MVICKYYQRGNCRYGQYCQFEHINNFGNRRTDESKSLAQVVAEEVLFAERGGQWLLSCFGPLKEKPCIPGMEDLSPDEVRWEIYQAQKNGTVEQAKMQYQRLCQEMKAKRDALKNPTSEMVLMLEKFERGGQIGGFNSGAPSLGKTSTFAFATPQLGLPSGTSSSNVFGNKSFSNQNSVFGSSTFGSSGSTSVFGRSTGTGTFGANPVFGSGTPFSSSTNTGSVFGSMTQTTAQPYSSMAQQSGSAFSGTTTQPVFGQPSVFGTTNQTTNVFARPQISQSSTSLFGGSNTLFGGSTPQQNTSLFGGVKTSTANPFGTASVGALQNTNPIFGTTPSAENPNMGASTLFGQPKTASGFGAAPAFGAAPTFGNNPVGAVFGQQPTFGNVNVFGSPNVTAPTFASVGQSTTAPTFAAVGQTTTAPFSGASVATTPSAFPSTTNAAPNFGQPANMTAFGSTMSTMSNPFMTASSPFTTTSTSTATPFSKPAFGTNTPAAPFGVANAGNDTFGNQNKSPFAPTSTTVTNTVSNPFAARTQQSNFPFGQTQNTMANTISGSQPFGKSPFATSITAIVDDSIYSIEGQLTDDEKSMYAAEKFLLGKIPLKPPTKDIR